MRYLHGLSPPKGVWGHSSVSLPPLPPALCFLDDAVDWMLLCSEWIKGLEAALMDHSVSKCLLNLIQLVHVYALFWSGRDSRTVLLAFHR